MRIIRRINRIAILILLGLFLALYLSILDIHVAFKIPFLVILSYVGEFISIICIMAFNMEDTISYKAFGADEYESQHYPVKLNQDGQIQR